MPLTVITTLDLPPVPADDRARRRRVSRLRRAAIKATAALVLEERWIVGEGQARAFIGDVFDHIGRAPPPVPKLDLRGRFRKRRRAAD